MKKFVFVCFLLSVSLALFSQQDEQKMTSKEKKAKKKAEREAYEAQLKQELAVSFDSAQWVLEATQIANKTGAPIQVNSTLNFVAIEGEDAFIQIGSNAGMGSNGVGGVSVDARISKYDVKKNEKNGSYYIQIYTNSSVGSFSINIDCSASGEYARATVQGNTSRQVQYTGAIVPLKKSKVYKGHARF